jgi:alkanesulfonate monooxygenase SsuD/methylene tetrahydromethanopterin reductase-like flavin-dependent oxidoreductase (luciferase family)
LLPALRTYRENFRPSEQLARPYAMAGCNVIAADTDAEARRLFTSPQQSFTNMLRNARGKLPPPIDDIETYWLPHEKAQASAMLARSFVGSAETIRRGLERFIAETGADELMATGNIYDQGARLHSYEILADVAGSLGREAVAA